MWELFPEEKLTSAGDSDPHFSYTGDEEELDEKMVNSREVEVFIMNGGHFSEVGGKCLF